MVGFNGWCIGVVMALKEATSEKFQDTWYPRLAQERRELSSSVEEALVYPSRQESFWLDDQNQHATAVGTQKSNNVFPPRLSLQSRSLPGTSFRVGTGLVNTYSNTARRPNIWTRFVKRLRSSLSAFRFHSSVAGNPAITPIADETVSIQSVRVEDVRCPAGGTSDPGDSCILSAITHEVSSKGECRVAAGTNAWN